MENGWKMDGKWMENDGKLMEHGCINHLNPCESIDV
jgi:hypothetical protein